MYIYDKYVSMRWRENSYLKRSKEKSKKTNANFDLEREWVEVVVGVWKLTIECGQFIALYYLYICSKCWTISI